jgi:N-acetyl-gamma-glutamyl-phosphate reductase
VPQKVFIDGQEGTTGLMIHERLKDRGDIELLRIASRERKNPEAKRDLYRKADIVILCLPDQASRDAFALARATDARLIDASTAFRTDPEWVYGLPELCPQQRDRIRNARYVSNCGCHAAGFILCVRPLVSAGLLPADVPLTCTSITGYSGGGKKLIQAFESAAGILPSRPYALGLRHKHLPEMQKHALLTHSPLFMPIVGHFYQGMLVSVPLVLRMLDAKVTPRAVHDTLTGYYAGEPFVNVVALGGEAVLEEGFLSPTGCNHTNRVDLLVFGHAGQIVIAARLDNLGKGASGTAVQCMNLMLGVEETAGLTR